MTLKLTVASKHLVFRGGNPTNCTAATLALSVSVDVKHHVYLLTGVVVVTAGNKEKDECSMKELSGTAAWLVNG